MLSVRNPSQIKTVIQTAAHQMYQIVRALCDCHITAWFSMRRIHQEMFGPGTTIQKTGYAICQQPSYRPSLALIIRYGGIQAITPVIRKSCHVRLRAYATDGR